MPELFNPASIFMGDAGSMLLGFTIAEVAAAAEVPANTVRSRLLNAKAALRKRLGEDPELYHLVRDAL